jgi:restriction endonuclease S subunit
MLGGLASKRGDVLLVIKGSVGKVGFVRDVPDKSVWLAGQSFAILRLRRHGPLTDPRVLHRFLSSNLGQRTLQSRCVGTTVPGLQMADVRRLPVVLPSPQQQKAIAQNVEALFDLQGRIQEMRNQLAQKQRCIWPDDETGDTALARAGPKSGKRKSSLPPVRRKTAS